MGQKLRKLAKSPSPTTAGEGEARAGGQDVGGATVPAKDTTPTTPTSNDGSQASSSQQIPQSAQTSQDNQVTIFTS